MTNITKEVWGIIESDLAIEKNLAQGLINTRALARYLIEKYSLKASLDSVISAIRRFETKTKFIDVENKLHNLFKDAVIKTRNNVACITISHNSHGFLDIIKSIKKGENMRIAVGSTSSKLMIEESKLKDITPHIREFSEKIEHDLSELSVTIDEKAIKTKGVLARIANEISLANINIEEFVIAPPEFLIYVKQEHILKTYESVLKLRDKEF